MPGPANDLNINQPGYVVFDGTATFLGRTFQAGTGISLSNADGIAGDTTITSTALGTVVTLTGNTGAAVSPNGSGNIDIVTANSTTVFAGTTNTLTINYNLNNLIFGSSLPSLTSGARNVGIGSNVLNALTSSTDNTAVGASALQSVSGGDLNTAVGSAAAASVNSGSANNAFGRNALLSCTSGGNNCAMGFGALGNCNTSNNVAIGHLSSVNVNSGNLNTTVGAATLQSATSGSQNSAFGYSALVLSTGSNNTALGYNAGSAFSSTESSNILISNNGTTADNNTIRIGTQGSGSGQQNLCFVAGITGVTTSNSQMVTVNTSTGQLGAAAIPASIIWSETSGAFSSTAGHGYFVTNTASTTLPASPALGDTIEFSIDTTNFLTITANTGQVIRLNTSVTATAGTAVNIARGCAMKLVYKTTGATWMAITSEGNWTLT